MIIAISIISYTIIGSIMAGWMRHDCQDDPDSGPTVAVFSIIWPLFLVLSLLIWLSNLSKNFFDNQSKKYLSKNKNKLSDLRKVRVKLEEVKKEFQQEKLIIKELEEELKGSNYEASAR